MIPCFYIQKRLNQCLLQATQIRQSYKKFYGIYYAYSWLRCPFSALMKFDLFVCVTKSTNSDVGLQFPCHSRACPSDAPSILFFFCLHMYEEKHLHFRIARNEDRKVASENMQSQLRQSRVIREIWSTPRKI